MYNVSYFKASSDSEVMAFMYAHPFVMLTGVDEHHNPVATHVPLLLELRGDKLFLLGHIMKKQAHTQAFAIHPQVLAIFYGPHSYVSASWYTKPESASTWNYQAVHAFGNLQFLNEERLLELLIKLTEKFEANPQSPSLVPNIGKADMEKMMNAIVGFEIEVMDIQHVFKLSQNRDERSYDNIVKQLSGLDNQSQAVAKEMQRRAGDVFKEKRP